MQDFLFMDLEDLFDEENLKRPGGPGPVFCGIIACTG